MTPSATTEPVRDRKYWTSVLHNAAKVPQDHPRYGEARQVIGMALESIGAEADRAADADIKALTPGKLGSAVVAFGHGASLGLAGEKEYLDLARQAHPILTTVADVTGAGATTALTAAGAAPILAGLSHAAKLGLAGGGTTAARGAIEPIFGLSRAESALITGAGGVILGSAVGKIVSKLLPIASTVARNVDLRLLGGRFAKKEAQRLMEAAIRAELQRLKVNPAMIETTVQAWKTGKVPTRSVSLAPRAPPPEPTPPVLRPGETVEQIAPRGFAVSGTRATPPVPTTPSLLEMQGFGKGQTLPYYPRGGVAEQSLVPAPPVSSPVPNYGPNQNAAFAEFLRGATPQDLGSRIGTLRALGVPLPANAEAELLAYLTGSTR